MKEDALPKRPWTVTTAYYLLWLRILVLPATCMLWDLREGGIGRRFLEDLINSSGSEPVDSGALAGAVGITLGYWIMLALVVYSIGKGRNGARIIYLIFVLTFTPGSLLSIIQDSGHSASPGPGPLYQIFQLEIDIVVVVLLFQRSSSDWFKAVEKLRSKDESPKEEFGKQSSSILYRW